MWNRVLRKTSPCLRGKQNEEENMLSWLQGESGRKLPWKLSLKTVTM